MHICIGRYESSAPCCGCRCRSEPMARTRASSQGGHCPLGSFVCWLATSVARSVSVSQTISLSGVSVTRSRGSWYPLVGRSRSGARLCSDGWGPASARLKARLVNLLTNSSMVSTPRSLAMTSFLTYHPAPAIKRSAIFCWAWKRWRCSPEQRAYQAGAA
ncbi:hypothetical protein EVAR_30900_1 [Eumeta japonica]|uniref:Uncharacterized protein n=1 Tax=Eumeta variegata TaxID=151549 RepID=A0A4C1V4V0_EUMVA|nr:hypothetical protein EVAR_30900_1 [Eumeta japonica]